MNDRRFSVSLEWTGRSRPQHVLRFCGDFLAGFTSRRSAVAARRQAVAARRAALVLQDLQA